MAAAADTSVCVFSSTQTGAPSLSNVAGNLIAVLDACLVNGWGLVTCDSVVIAEGVGTATINSGHAAIADGVVLFAGATGTLADVNGRRKVKSITAATVAFDAADLADGTVTGTITMKIAPAGWTKAFSGTNLAAYKSANVQASGTHLYVDDTTTTYASVRGYESMTSISTGTGQTPTTAQASVSCWWKSTSATASRWWVIANDRFMYIGIATGTASYPNAFLIVGCGDTESRRPADAYRWVLISLNMTSVGSPAGAVNPIGLQSASNGLRYMPRSWTGVASAITVSLTWMDASVASSGSGHPTLGRPYPNPADNAIISSKIHLVESSGAYRSALPGCYATPQTTGSLIDSDTPIDDLPVPGRRSLYKQWAYGVSTPAGLFFDVTGPWGA